MKGTTTGFYMAAVALMTHISTTAGENSHTEYGPSRRQARSIAFPELVQIIPLLTGPRQPSDPVGMGNQLFSDGAVVPPEHNRQVPVPPPPTPVAPPPPQATTAAPAPATTSPAQNLLQLLLPLIGLTTMMGGSFGSGELARLMPALLASKLGLGNAAGPLRPPPIFRDVSPFVTMTYNNNGNGYYQDYSPPIYPDLVRSLPLEKKTTDRCVRSTPICEDAPFDKIVSIGDNIFAMKGSRVYKINSDGTPVSPDPIASDPMFKNLSSAANIRGTDYIFQGSHYFKVNDGSTTEPRVRLVEDGFPGVPVPVDGAFQLDHRTFIFISGSRFVYYQPDANPPVNPSYSPQFMENIQGAPTTVDSVFKAGSQLYLYKRGRLYELQPGQMAVKRELPLKSEAGLGWLNCPEISLKDCNYIRPVEGSAKERAPYKRMNGP